MHIIDDIIEATIGRVWRVADIIDDNLTQFLHQNKEPLGQPAECKINASDSNSIAGVKFDFIRSISGPCIKLLASKKDDTACLFVAHENGNIVWQGNEGLFGLKLR